MSRLILFVDDSSVARAAVIRAIRQLGAPIQALASAAETEGVEAGGLGAALLDIELGDGLGTEVAERLRQGAPALPIAFLTSGGPAEVLEAARRLGPVFEKSDELDDAVRWVVDAARR